MVTKSLVWSLTVSAALGLLSGCGPSSSVGLTPTAFNRSARHASHRVMPNASSGDLLYVSDGENATVDIFSYPQGVKVGQLTGLSPGGLCADAAGDVFVTNSVASGSSEILEFAHGGKTPIQKLNDPGMLPSGCAVDPVTGNLAVTNYCPDSHGSCGNGRGNVLIYPKAKGTPKHYAHFSIFHFYFCGYDDTGALYADGSGRRANFFDLVKLPKNGEKLVIIPVHWKRSGSEIVNPGAVQWDGKYLAVGEEQVEHFEPSVYRIAPATGRIVAILPLRRSQFVQQFFVYDKVLIAPNETAKHGHFSGQVLFYRYPQGGSPVSSIGGLDMPIAAVVSPGT